MKRLVTDGGVTVDLPETFEEFVSRATCPACGDVVDDDQMEGNVCVGCARRDNPTTSAEAGLKPSPTGVTAKFVGMVATVTVGRASSPRPSISG